MNHPAVENCENNKKIRKNGNAGNDSTILRVQKVSGVAAKA
jgi:hypothetical protein